MSGECVTCQSPVFNRKLGWRLGLQAVTGVLALGFFLGVLYRSASLYHPQRRAILHLKNQRNKVKEKDSISAAQKTPFFDLSPLRIRAVQMLLLASSMAALGVYTPVFYLALQGYKEGLEDSALVLMQTFLGFATALGCVGFGLVVVRPSEQCLISRQYLCQAAMVGVGKAAYTSVSQPPGRGPVPGPGINYTGPTEILLEFVILVF